MFQLFCPRLHVAWQRWKRWAVQFPEIASFPVKPFEFPLYIRELVDTADSIAQIEAAVYGVRWAHNMAAIPSPTDHAFVKATLEGCKRLAKTINPKEPISTDVLSKLVLSQGGSDAEIDKLRFLVLCLVGFASFMRISEFLKEKIRDVQFHDTQLSISVPKRKNDQYRQGHVINVSRSGKATCPVVRE